MSFVPPTFLNFAFHWFIKNHKRWFHLQVISCLLKLSLSAFSNEYGLTVIIGSYLSDIFSKTNEFINHSKSSMNQHELKILAATHFLQYRYKILNIQMSLFIHRNRWCNVYLTSHFSSHCYKHKFRSIEMIIQISLYDTDLNLIWSPKIRSFERNVNTIRLDRLDHHSKSIHVAKVWQRFRTKHVFLLRRKRDRLCEKHHRATHKESSLSRAVLIGVRSNLTQNTWRTTSSTLVNVSSIQRCAETWGLDVECALDVEKDESDCIF